MQQINRSSKHKEKLNYLEGILTGWHSIYEILDRRVFFFMESEVPGIFNRMQSEELKPEERDTRKYTIEQIEKIKKLPNTWVSHRRLVSRSRL